jgi:hypothetical protein
MQRCDKEIGVKAKTPTILLLTMALVMAIGAQPADAGLFSEMPTDGKIVKVDGSSVIFSEWQEDGQRFVQISKDGGATWSEARAMVDKVSFQESLMTLEQATAAATKKRGADIGNRVFVVQFKTQSLSEWRRLLREAGVEVLTYVPYDSHLVRMDASQVAAVEALPFVSRVGVYEPEFRVAPALLADLGDPDVTTRRFRLMTFVSGAEDKAALADEVAAVGGTITLANPEGYIVEADLTDSQALELLKSNNLQWMDEWSEPEDDMNNGRVVSGADHVFGAGGFDGTGVRAEVMDGNVDQNHGDFATLVLHGTVSGDDSHGTCTYGINFGDGTGSAAATGMVPAAQGYFASYSTLTNRYTHTSELVDPGMTYKCVYQSNSWGNSRTLSYNTYSAQMDDIIWMYDILIHQSQSNAGDQMSRPQAWSKNIMSVGGAYHWNDTIPTNDDWNFGASIGPAADGRVKPDLTFFYDSIYTTDADPGGYSGGPYTTNFGGTSGATPMVAGTGGLMYQMWSENVWGTSPTDGTVFEDRPHFTTMKALMINSAEQYDWTTTNPDLTRFRQGWGYPNAQNAYDRAAMMFFIDEESVLQELESDTYTATVPAAQDALKITMVYSDRAGVPGSNPHRINDVTLKVTAPDGTTVYWGNFGLDTNLWSVSGGSEDTINTVENVFVQNPAEGTWTIEVIATEVNMDVHAETPEDDQDYALVIYGASAFSGGGSIFADGFESGGTTNWSNVVP